MWARNLNRTVLALTATTLISACAMGQRDSFTVGSVPTDYKKNHPIVLSETEQTHDIPVASGARKLSYAALSNVKSFAVSFAGSGTGTMVMMLPVGSANSGAADHVRSQVLDALEQSGVSRHAVTYQSYDASAHGSSAPIRLSYRAVTASTGDCGSWTQDLGRNPENVNYADFGCSTQNNLAAQIQNPGDLLGPRAETPIDAGQRQAVIEAYRGGN